MKQRIACITLALIGLAAPLPAQDGQGPYPTRPLMMVITSEVGGGTDYQARIVTKQAADPAALGMPIAMLNKPGGSGHAGWAWFATQALSDGYTLAAYSVPDIFAQPLEGGAEYLADSFEPLANWGADPAVLLVPSDSPITSVSDMVDYARANPGMLTLTGAGPFTGPHLATLQLEQAAGITVDFQPAEGGGKAALKAVMAGQVMGGISTLSDALRAQAAGQVRILGLFDLTRHARIPQVPTFREQGFEIDDLSVTYRGVMAPKDTPPQIIDRLAATLPQMFADDAVAAKMAANGAPMRIMTRGDVQALWMARQQAVRNLLEGL